MNHTKRILIDAQHVQILTNFMDKKQVEKHILIFIL
jgi:hypothetical protein